MGHCPDCQVVKVCCLKLVEFFCVSVYLYVWYFSLLEISFPLFAVERCSLSSEALSNATGSLKLFLLSFSSGINSSILSAPSTIILFYYSTNIVFLLESRSFLPSLHSCDILEQSVSVSFQDFIIHYYKFSKLCVEFG